MFHPNLNPAPLGDDQVTAFAALVRPSERVLVGSGADTAWFNQLYMPPVDAAGHASNTSQQTLQQLYPLEVVLFADFRFFSSAFGMPRVARIRGESFAWREKTLPKSHMAPVPDEVVVPEVTPVPTVVPTPVATVVPTPVPTPWTCQIRQDKCGLRFPPAPAGPCFDSVVDPGDPPYCQCFNPCPAPPR